MDFYNAYHTSYVYDELFLRLFVDYTKISHENILNTPYAEDQEEHPFSFAMIYAYEGLEETYPNLLFYHNLCVTEYEGCLTANVGTELGDMSKKINRYLVDFIERFSR